MEYVVPGYRSNTERGMLHLRWSLVVAVAMQALSIAFVAWFAILLTRIPLDANPFDPAYVGEFSAFIGLDCGSILVGLAAGVIFLVGLSELRAGRGEFGAEHARDVDRVAVCTVVASVTALVSALSGVLIGHGVGAILWTPDSTSAVVFGGIGVARGLSVGLAFATALQFFAPVRDRRLSFLAVVLLTANPVAAAAFSVLSPMPIAVGDPVATYRALWTFVLVAPAIAAVDLVAYVLFYRSFARVCRRMRAREIWPAFLPQPVPLRSSSPPSQPSSPPSP